MWYAIFKTGYLLFIAVFVPGGQNTMSPAFDMKRL